MPHRTAVLESAVASLVAHPVRAALTVGISILVLNALLRTAAAWWWSPLALLLFAVPFLPSYVVARTAKRINQRRAEYAFVRDTEGIVLIAHLTAVTRANLLEARPEMISACAARYLQDTPETILQRPLVAAFTASAREALTRRLLEAYDAHPERAVLRSTPVSLKGLSTSFVMTSILVPHNNGIKWQVLLLPMPASPLPPTA